MNNFHSLANSLKIIEERKGNFKSAIFENKLKQQIHPSQYKKAYSIIIKTYKNLNKIKEFIQEVLQKQNVKISNIYLFAITVNEYFFGKLKESKAGGQMKRIIKENEQVLATYLNVQQDQDKKLNQDQYQIRKEVYLRIQNNRISIQELQNKFQMQLFPDNLVQNLFKMCYSDYQQQSENLRTDILKNSVVIQGKSSCLTPFMLFQNTPKTLLKFDVIDTCSAPGNKTLQLSEYLGQKGTVFAFELDAKRHKLLQKRLHQYETKNVDCVQGDFLKTDPNDQKYKNVRYIMLDPSCSGSGMLNNLFFSDNNFDNLNYEEKCINLYKNLSFDDKQRVIQLASFQTSMILHAMKFPSVQKIAYSTCSIYPIENEKVVKKISQVQQEFKVINACKSWDSKRGFKSITKKASKLVRTDPFKDNIDGFFVAVFKRKQ